MGHLLTTFLYFSSSLSVGYGPGDVNGRTMTVLIDYERSPRSSPHEEGGMAMRGVRTQRPSLHVVYLFRTVWDVKMDSAHWTY